MHLMQSSYTWGKCTMTDSFMDVDPLFPRHARESGDELEDLRGSGRCLWWRLDSEVMASTLLVAATVHDVTIVERNG